jgi:hypothetical protein
MKACRKGGLCQTRPARCCQQSFETTTTHEWCPAPTYGLLICTSLHSERHTLSTREIIQITRRQTQRLDHRAESLPSHWQAVRSSHAMLGCPLLTQQAKAALHDTRQAHVPPFQRLLSSDPSRQSFVFNDHIARMTFACT